MIEAQILFGTPCRISIIPLNQILSLVRHEIGDSDIEWDADDHDPDGDHDGTEPGVSSISDRTIRC